MPGSVYPQFQKTASPLESAHAQKHFYNSFGICTYKSLDLKSFAMNSYKKYRGVGGLRVLQTQDLRTLFVAPTFILLCCRDLRPKHNVLAEAAAAGM